MLNNYLRQSIETDLKNSIPFEISALKYGRNNLKLVMEIYGKISFVLKSSNIISPLDIDGPRTDEEGPVADEVAPGGDVGLPT